MVKVATWWSHKPSSFLPTVGRLFLVILPGLVLLAGNLRAWALGQEMPPLLWLGMACQILVCFIVVIQQGWQRPAGPTVLVLYLIALAWLWFGGAGAKDWYVHLSQAILLVASVGIFALQVFTESGAPDLRRARVLAQQLADRRDWPAHIGDCRTLPEVKALREALHLDPTPALALLVHPRPQVCIAALTALEFRKDWRRDQAELVLGVAQRSPEPSVQAAAIFCLANVDRRAIIERLADMLDDPSWEVRRAATEGLLWDTERRWPWIRQGVRNALSNPAHQDDGPLLQNRQMLSVEAVKDFTAWTTEKGVLGLRASQTLAVHYGRAINESADPKLIQELGRQMVDPHAPPPLRLELAQLFQQNHLLDKPLQEKLLAPVNPAPLRLVAAEGLLASGTHAGAIEVLREIAHLPNREIALATAEVVQRRLGADMGLALGQPLPPLNSRKAAEVTRRVMMWAAAKEPPVAAASRD